MYSGYNVFPCIIKNKLINCGAPKLIIHILGLQPPPPPTTDRQEELPEEPRGWELILNEAAVGLSLAEAFPVAGQELIRPLEWIRWKYELNGMNKSDGQQEEKKWKEEKFLETESLANLFPLVIHN